MRANLLRVSGLAIWSVLFYFILMVTDNDASGGVVGPGIQTPPPSAYAQELQKKAASRAPTDLAEVKGALTSDTGLLRLNTAEEYAQLSAEKIALRPILVRLARNGEPAAREIIATLCESAPFLAEDVRVEAVLHVLPELRPLPPAALALLRKTVASEEAAREIAVQVLFEIGDQTTLEIFSAQVLKPEQDPVTTQGWMRDALLRKRRSPAVLDLSLHLLQNPSFDAELKNSLVEALFDYRPAEWYTSEGSPPKPPAPTKLSTETRELLKKIAATIAADAAISPQNKTLAAEKVKKSDDPR